MALEPRFIESDYVPKVSDYVRKETLGTTRSKDVRTTSPQPPTPRFQTAQCSITREQGVGLPRKPRSSVEYEGRKHIYGGVVGTTPPLWGGGCLNHLPPPPLLPIEPCSGQALGRGGEEDQTYLLPGSGSLPPFPLGPRPGLPAVLHLGHPTSPTLRLYREPVLHGRRGRAVACGGLHRENPRRISRRQISRQVRETFKPHTSFLEMYPTKNLRSVNSQMQCTPIFVFFPLTGQDRISNLLQPHITFLLAKQASLLKSPS